MPSKNSINFTTWPAAPFDGPSAKSFERFWDLARSNSESTDDQITTTPTERSGETWLWSDLSPDGITEIHGTVRLSTAEGPEQHAAAAARILASYLVARLTDKGAREALREIASIVDREIGGELLSTPDLPRFVVATNGQNSSERFDMLVDRWREETMVYSSLHDIVLNDAYQQIIGMGPSALPYIVEDFQASPDHWGWALKAITGLDPVKSSSEGNLEAMRTDWMNALNVP